MSTVDTAAEVRIAVRAVGTREYNSITVVIGDLHLRCDITCDRDIRQAYRLAINHGCRFVVQSPELQGRVDVALKGLLEPR